jgi:hypothetical protein
VSASALPAPASEKASAAATALVIFTDVHTVDSDNKMFPLSVVGFGATPRGTVTRSVVGRISPRWAGLTSGDGRPGHGWRKAQVEGAVPYHPDTFEGSLTPEDGATSLLDGVHAPESVLRQVGLTLT